MDCKSKDVIRSVRVLLSEDLTLEELWNPLVQVGLFTPIELKRIGRPNSGNEVPMTRLLDVLEQKGPKALELFKTALKDVNKPHILDMINKCHDEKEKLVKIDKDDLHVLVAKENNTKLKKEELKKLVNEICDLQPDGSYKVTKEKKDLLVEKLENLDQIDGEDIKLCGTCICIEDNLCTIGKCLQEDNKKLQRQLDLVKNGSVTKIVKIKEAIDELLETATEEEDTETLSGSLKMGMNKLVLDIENEKESFA